MSSQSRNNPFRAAIIVFTFVAAITLWRYSSGSPTSTTTASRTAPDSPAMAASKDHADALSKLAVDIRQTATSPPTLAVKVINNYDSPLTILTWESPLDPAAIALGLLSITPAGADKPLDLPIVQFRRVMPPEPDNLVTLQPGESRGQDLVLKEPAVPVGELGGKASIYIKGSWSSVWPTTADKLTPEELEKLQFGDSVLSGGEFKSDVIEVTVG
ncbi:putative secreted protein like [Verticillium longisporum]|uniref:Putative secreted protein like n=1 Tax=Verticillium longisporum TaxID=100787 RepID=A0A8I3AP87_VERLO|nr:putative secreted protein like [Verticillium longisporum]